MGRVQILQTSAGSSRGRRENRRTEELGGKAWERAERLGLGAELLEAIRRLVAFLNDTEVPLMTKGIAVAAILYFLNPFDVVPDFAPGGLVDDAAVIFAALKRLAEKGAFRKN